MNAARALRSARRRAGLSQRDLAQTTGIAQPTIARIERAAENPRVSTLQTLLEACNETLEAVPRSGGGIDRTEIRELLALPPVERIRRLTDESLFLERVATARRVG